LCLLLAYIYGYVILSMNQQQRECTMSRTTDYIINRIEGVTPDQLRTIDEMEKREEEQADLWVRCFNTIKAIDDELQVSFMQFHTDNPHVYDGLRRLALQTKRMGRDNYSINGLYEVLRWHRSFDTTDDEFKISNNHRAYYARLLMESEPELEGFFRTRKTRSEM